MVVSHRCRGFKLSTGGPRGRKRFHNHVMNDDNPAGGLARFLTLADAAQLLNITTKQAYDLVHTGELPAIRVGAAGHWRVERSVMESYIDAKYEETRRYALWHQSDFANVSAYAFSEL